MVSYDRLIENAEVDAYVSFDNDKVGELQAESLSEKLKEDGSPKGPIVKINGDPADRNAALFKEGSNKGLRSRRRRESPRNTTRRAGRATNAQSETQQAITALGKDGFAGRLRGQRRHRRRRDRGDESRPASTPKNGRPPARTRPSPACSGSSPASST